MRLVYVPSHGEGQGKGNQDQDMVTAVTRICHMMSNDANRDRTLN